jgi:2-dehydro-3-deoxygluconokinase
MAEPRPVDVWTLGETMVRFTPKAFARLEEGGEWDVRTGGSESNVAVGLTRLGRRVAWVSKLPRNPLGRLIARRIASFGVDVEQVLWSDLGRAGVYFIEPGAAPRPTRVLYDRAGSAASTMAPDEFDWTALDGVRHVHLSGITPALSDSCCQTVARALTEAKARGCSISFDVNYRARLWGHAAARVALAPLVAQVDLLICTEVDARLVFELSGGWQEVLRGLHAMMSGGGAVALTLGSSGAAVYTGRDYYQATAFEVSEVDRVGAGDAFDAGLIWGCLEGDLQKGLNYGTAMAALKHTLPGDEFTATADEVEALLESASVDIQR